MALSIVLSMKKPALNKAKEILKDQDSKKRGNYLEKELSMKKLI